MFYKPEWPAVIFVMWAFQMKTLFNAMKTEFRICEIELRFSCISSLSPDKCQDNIVADRYGNKSPKKTISLFEAVYKLYEILPTEKSGACQLLCSVSMICCF
jgi:hypothetical protein